jgi:hypothetical protein
LKCPPLFELITPWRLYMIQYGRGITLAFALLLSSLSAGACVANASDSQEDNPALMFSHLADTIAADIEALNDLKSEYASIDARLLIERFQEILIQAYGSSMTLSRIIAVISNCECSSDTPFILLQTELELLKINTHRIDTDVLSFISITNANELFPKVTSQAIIIKNKIQLLTEMAVNALSDK